MSNVVTFMHKINVLQGEIESGMQMYTDVSVVLKHYAKRFNGGNTTALL